MKRLFIILSLAILSGVIYCQTTPDWLWATGAGGTIYDYGRGIATDSNGNSYVTGIYEGTANFGETTLISNGTTDIFVAKLDNNGNWLWAKQTGGTTDVWGRSITTDISGNCYITGRFNGTTTFGTISLSSFGNSDIYIAKLDTNGNWLWVKSAGGLSEDCGFGISADISGNTYVTGTFEGNVNVGMTSLSSNGYEDIFIAKLDTDGNWLWAISAGGAGNDGGYGIATDVIGNCSITGYFGDTVYFGEDALVCNGLPDLFVAKFDTNGNWLWAKSAGSTSWDSSNGITTDANGNCYVTGYFDGTTTLGSTSLTSSGDYDIFVTKLDTNGNWLWAKKAGGTSLDYGEGIASDSSGNCFLTGCYTDTAMFGSSSLTSNTGSRDIYVTKLDTNGTWQWVKSAGGWLHDSGFGIATISNGSIYITGQFSESAFFDTLSVNSIGLGDIFVAKLASDGTFIDDEVIPEYTSLSHLYNAYPNPLGRGIASTIKADIAPSETGSITIYNLKGQVVESHQLGSGSHNIEFSCKDLASGIYFYRLQTPTVNEVKKLVLLRE